MRRRIQRSSAGESRAAINGHCRANAVQLLTYLQFKSRKYNVRLDLNWYWRQQFNPMKGAGTKMFLLNLLQYRQTATKVVCKKNLPHTLIIMMMVFHKDTHFIAYWFDFSFLFQRFNFTRALQFYKAYYRHFAKDSKANLLLNNFPKVLKVSNTKESANSWTDFVLIKSYYTQFTSSSV